MNEMNEFQLEANFKNLIYIHQLFGMGRKLLLDGSATYKCNQLLSCNFWLVKTSNMKDHPNLERFISYIQEI